jgi:hypothetical protein
MLFVLCYVMLCCHMYVYYTAEGAGGDSGGVHATVKDRWMQGDAEVTAGRSIIYTYKMCCAVCGVLLCLDVCAILVMYCTALHCTALHYTALHCVLFFMNIICAVQLLTILFYRAIRHATPGLTRRLGS